MHRVRKIVRRRLKFCLHMDRPIHWQSTSVLCLFFARAAGSFPKVPLDEIYYASGHGFYLPRSGAQFLHAQNVSARDA